MNEKVVFSQPSFCTELLQWLGHEKYITICGIGSLMSENSARKTFPNLKAFRKGYIENYQRAFNLVDLCSIKRGFIDFPTDELMCLSAVKITEQDLVKCNKLLVILFEIPTSSFQDFVKREQYYQFSLVQYFDFTTSLQGQIKKAVLCCQSTDEIYRSTYFHDDSEYHVNVGQYFSGRLWYNIQDINTTIYKPSRRYLKLCLQAARLLGSDYLDNFLDNSFLMDGHTSIRSYLSSNEELEISLLSGTGIELSIV